MDPHKVCCVGDDPRYRIIIIYDLYRIYLIINYKKSLLSRGKGTICAKGLNGKSNVGY